jgi:hypothetical protein
VGSNEEEQGAENSRLQKEQEEAHAASLAPIVFHFNLLEIMRQVTIVGCAATDISAKDISIYPFVFNPVTQIPFSHKEIKFFTDRMQTATTEYALRMQSRTFLNQTGTVIGTVGVVASSLAIGLGLAASMPSLLNAAPAAVTGSMPVIVENALSASKFITSKVPENAADFLNMFALGAFSTKTAIEAHNLITTGNNSTVFQKLSACTKEINDANWKDECNKDIKRQKCLQKIEECNKIREQRNILLNDLGHKAYEVALYTAVTTTIPLLPKRIRIEEAVKFFSDFEYKFKPTVDALGDAYKLSKDMREALGKALVQALEKARELLADAGYKKLELKLNEWEEKRDSFSLALNTQIIADEVNYRVMLPVKLSLTDSEPCQIIKKWVISKKLKEWVNAKIKIKSESKFAEVE